MAVVQKNTYVIGSNSDLSNALLNIDLNRVVGQDRLTVIDDSGTLKVAVGSLVEANGSIYAVEGTAATPSGTAAAQDYLYFDPTGPSFEWNSAAGTWSDALQGWYNSGKKRTAWRVLNASTPEAYKTVNAPPGGLDQKVWEIGDWNMDGFASVDITHNMTAGSVRAFSAIVRDDTEAQTSNLEGSKAAGFQKGEVELFSTIFKLSRGASGPFNSTFYDATSFNRGWLYVWFEA